MPSPFFILLKLITLSNYYIINELFFQGADVNACQHENKYTALHFGALSGNINVCEKLLRAGAKTDVTNSVGRTASQMAAFVGNYNNLYS